MARLLAACQTMKKTHRWAVGNLPPLQSTPRVFGSSCLSPSPPSMQHHYVCGGTESSGTNRHSLCLWGTHSIAGRGQPTRPTFTMQSGDSQGE